MTKWNYFGTDGIRGRVGQAPMTPELILKLGYAIGRVLGKDKHAHVVIGKDTRLSGYLFESVLEAGLSAAGVKITLFGPMPTPGIACLTKQLQADAGVVISASHNPYYDNGIKLFDANGHKISDEIESQIEDLMQQPLEITQPDSLGKAQRYPAAVELYKHYCKNAISTKFARKIKCVVDCANGATYHIAPDLLRELGLEVIALHTAPDGLNINHECGSTDLSSVCEAVRKYKADFGLAFDGDGDRVLFVDEKGQHLDGDDLLYILVRDGLQNKTLEGGVVGTVMTNLGLEQYLATHNIPFKRSLVGDKHVLKQLIANNWQLGGESSGHIINLNYGTTGDGIMTALQVIRAYDSTSGSFSDLTKEFARTPQTLMNFPVSSYLKKKLLDKPVVTQAIDTVKAELAGNGRILVRMSGTEPLLRVMLESKDQLKINTLSEYLQEKIKQASIESSEDIPALLDEE